ncbi:unnamed protein product [Rotaria sp. Silwood1]|nr:unnamed protein product [Rotaria sp. Silwood1]CAF1312345.1 unnamed protein product [Rotaria sp. Silwood1]CAF1314046.1 unnamed protein product [Rotaria sp. Silwood1]CAF3543832.1 unnamed protein product [Rotaria sp. Silwood1]CAF3557396.1 unnamed protein product [Rotaria sp. Silwood1]
MSKGKEQIKVILSGNDDKRVNIKRDTSLPTHLQIREYLGAFGDDDSTTCTYDWYDAQEFNAKHLENYVCSFVGSVEDLTKSSDGFFNKPQKPNPYYFTKCEKCGYIILTNRDIGKKLVCMNPQERCSHYNHTQPLSNDAFMSDILELVNEHYKLNLT